MPKCLSSLQPPLCNPLSSLGPWDFPKGPVWPITPQLNTCPQPGPATSCAPHPTRCLLLWPLLASPQAQAAPSPGAPSPLPTFLPAGWLSFTLLLGCGWPRGALSGCSPTAPASGCLPWARIPEAALSPGCEHTHWSAMTGVPARPSTRGLEATGLTVRLRALEPACWLGALGQVTVCLGTSLPVL